MYRISTKSEDQVARQDIISISLSYNVCFKDMYTNKAFFMDIIAVD